MKKILYSTLVLTAFSLSIILFQMSCQDEVQAQIYQPIKNRFLYTYQKENGIVEYWTAKDDGTDYVKLAIALPETLKLGSDGVFSSDGKRLIVSATDQMQQTHIYSISIEGNDVEKLVDGTGSTDPLKFFRVVQAY